MLNKKRVKVTPKPNQTFVISDGEGVKKSSLIKDVVIKKKKKVITDEIVVVKKKKKKKAVVESIFEMPSLTTPKKAKLSREDKHNATFAQLFPAFATEEHVEAAERYEKARKKLRSGSSEGMQSIDDMFSVDPNTGMAIPKHKDLILPEDFDIRALMDSATDPLTGTLRDLKIDDRDLPVAKNFYDFSFNIIGKDAHPPWARQMWTGLMLFGEVCPCCSDKRWLQVENVPKDYPSKNIKDKLCLLEHGKCPKCKREKWDLMKNHGLRNYQQLVNVLGQRSGKSSSAAGYAAYATHRYLKFPNLSTLTTSSNSAAMQASTELTGTFVSLNLFKAVGVLWTPYRKMIENSQWFKDYFAMLDFYKHKYGKELYRDSTMYMTFFHKNLKFYPSGPRSSTLRGDTRILGVIDELGLFPLPTGDEEEDEQSERANADEAHKSLMNSLATVSSLNFELLQDGYSAVPPALLMCVSSPIAQRDKVMRLLRESRTDEGSKYILGVNLPTWEVNPNMSRDTPLIAMAYNSNREKAERDFGANPPMVHSTFIKPNVISEGVFVGGQNSHVLKYCLDRPGQIYGKLEKVRSVKWPSLITIDAGHVNNSFTITAGHYDFDNHKTVVSTVLECMPQEGRVINFTLLYEHVILPLAKDVNAVAMLADQWQSIELLYRLVEDMGMNPLQKPRLAAKQHSPKRRDFVAASAMLENRNLILPTVPSEDFQKILDGRVENWRIEMNNKPQAHLMLQMLTVQDQGETRCPAKGDGFTDDIYRAFVLLGSKIHEPKIMERLKAAKDFLYGPAGRKAMPMPAFAGRSGGMMRR